MQLRLIQHTEMAVWYEDIRTGRRKWIPKSVCQVREPFRMEPGEIHEVEIASWWLDENSFDPPDTPQEELKL